MLDSLWGSAEFLCQLQRRKCSTYEDWNCGRFVLMLTVLGYKPAHKVSVV